MGDAPATRVEAALYVLCVDYGICLPPSAEAALVADPPRQLDAFVDAVLAADGRPSAELCDPAIVSWVTGVVHDWLFDDGQGKGTRSGLPFTLGDGDR